MPSSTFRVSPIYATPALVPVDAPIDWSVPYLNAVAEIHWDGTPQDLLKTLKEIETFLGRKSGPRWSPRVIDLDLLTFGDQILSSDDTAGPSGSLALQVPHPEMTKRSFVLDPLRDLAPNFQIPGFTQATLSLARQLPMHSPLIMGIINLTPDSFSDGGDIRSLEGFLTRAELMDQAGTHIIDLGAESTRPGATQLTSDEEWLRLKEPLLALRQLFSQKIFRPRISVDTRHPLTAQKALKAGADWINDVSGLDDPEMVSVLKDSDCDIVMMHHLGIPADPKSTLSRDIDPVAELKSWCLQKLEMLETSGISLHRVIFDPGIGFGKTSHQSLALLKNIKSFQALPVRLLVGHSRKSFMKVWNLPTTHERDSATLGASLGLASQGVDILRVHTPEDHITALHARLETF